MASNTMPTKLFGEDDAPVLAKLIDRNAYLEAEHERTCDALGRLANWAAQNDRERHYGHAPTWLNPHTVAMWLGADLSKHGECRQAEGVAEFIATLPTAEEQ